MEVVPAVPSPRRPSRSAWRSLLIALALLTPLHTAALTAYAGVDVPIQDELTLVTLLERQHDGALAAGDLWALHNEHRPVLPRLLMLGLAGLTGWNIRAELAVVWLLAATTLALLVRLLSATGQAAGASVLWAAPALSSALFSFAQFENWLWGWQITMVGVATLAVAALGLLASPGRWAFAGAAAAAASSALCMAAGLVVWPAGLLVLWWAHEGRERRLRLAGWTALGALVWLLYFQDYHPQQLHPRAGLADAPAAAAYVLAFLGALPGAPLGVAGAATLGAAGLALLVVAAAPRAGDPPGLRRVVGVWLGIAGWALLVGGLCAFGRVVKAGPGHGMASSRYLACTAPFWCAVVAVVAARAVVAGSLVWRRGALALVVAVTAVALARSAAEHGFAANWRRNMTRAAQLAAEGERQAYLHLDVYTDVETTTRRMDFLRRRRLSLFRER